MNKMVILLISYVTIIVVVLTLFIAVFSHSNTPASSDRILQFSVTVENTSYLPANETSGTLNVTVLPRILENDSLWITGYKINGTEVDIPVTHLFTDNTFTFIQYLTSSSPITAQKLDCALLASDGNNVTREAPFSVDLYIPKNYDFSFSSGANSSSGLGR